MASSSSNEGFESSDELEIVEEVRYSMSDEDFASKLLDELLAFNISMPSDATSSHSTFKFSSEADGCPICWETMEGPIIMPCNHRLCKRCFVNNIEMTSLQCPFYRKCFGIWYTHAKQIDMGTEKQLMAYFQSKFPDRVKAAENGAYCDDETSENIFSVEFQCSDDLGDTFIKTEIEDGMNVQCETSESIKEGEGLDNTDDKFVESVDVMDEKDESGDKSRSEMVNLDTDSVSEISLSIDPPLRKDDDESTPDAQIMHVADEINVSIDDKRNAETSSEIIETNKDNISLTETNVAVANNDTKDKEQVFNDESQVSITSCEGTNQGVDIIPTSTLSVENTKSGKPTETIQISDQSGGEDDEITEIGLPIPSSDSSCSEDEEVAQITEAIRKSNNEQHHKSTTKSPIIHRNKGIGEVVFLSDEDNNPKTDNSKDKVKYPMTSPTMQRTAIENSENEHSRDICLDVVGRSLDSVVVEADDVPNKLDTVNDKNITKQVVLKEHSSNDVKIGANESIAPEQIKIPQVVEIAKSKLTTENEILVGNEVEICEVVNDGIETSDTMTIEFEDKHNDTCVELLDNQANSKIENTEDETSMEDIACKKERGLGRDITKRHNKGVLAKATCNNISSKLLFETVIGSLSRKGGETQVIPGLTYAKTEELQKVGNKLNPKDFLYSKHLDFSGSSKNLNDKSGLKTNVKSNDDMQEEIQIIDELPSLRVNMGDASTSRTLNNPFQVHSNAADEKQHASSALFNTVQSMVNSILEKFQVEVKNEIAQLSQKVNFLIDVYLNQDMNRNPPFIDNPPNKRKLESRESSDEVTFIEQSHDTQMDRMKTNDSSSNNKNVKIQATSMYLKQQFQLHPYIAKRQNSVLQNNPHFPSNISNPNILSLQRNVTEPFAKKKALATENAKNCRKMFVNEGKELSKSTISHLGRQGGLIRQDEIDYNTSEESIEQGEKNVTKVIFPKNKKIGKTSKSKISDPIPNSIQESKNSKIGSDLNKPSSSTSNKIPSVDRQTEREKIAIVQQIITGKNRKNVSDSCVIDQKESSKQNGTLDSSLLQQSAQNRNRKQNKNQIKSMSDEKIDKIEPKKADRETAKDTWISDKLFNASLKHIDISSIIPSDGQLTPRSTRSADPQKLDQPMVFEHHSVTKKAIKDVDNCREKKNAPKKTVSFVETPPVVIPIIPYADELDTDVEDESTYNNTESEDLSTKVDESMTSGKNETDKTEATKKLNTSPSENSMKLVPIEYPTSVPNMDKLQTGSDSAKTENIPKTIRAPTPPPSLKPKDVSPTLPTETKSINKNKQRHKLFKDSAKHIIIEPYIPNKESNANQDKIKHSQKTSQVLKTKTPEKKIESYIEDMRNKSKNGTNDNISVGESITAKDSTNTGTDTLIQDKIDGKESQIHSRIILEPIINLGKNKEKSDIDTKNSPEQIKNVPNQTSTLVESSAISTPKKDKHRADADEKKVGKNKRLEKTLDKLLSSHKNNNDILSNIFDSTKSDNKQKNKPGEKSISNQAQKGESTEITVSKEFPLNKNKTVITDSEDIDIVEIVKITSDPINGNDKHHNDKGSNDAKDIITEKTDTSLKLNDINRNLEEALQEKLKESTNTVASKSTKENLVQPRLPSILETNQKSKSNKKTNDESVKAHKNNLDKLLNGLDISSILFNSRSSRSNDGNRLGSNDESKAEVEPKKKPNNEGKQTEEDNGNDSDDCNIIEEIVITKNKSLVTDATDSLKDKLDQVVNPEAQQNLARIKPCSTVIKNVSTKEKHANNQEVKNTDSIDSEPKKSTKEKKLLKKKQIGNDLEKLLSGIDLASIISSARRSRSVEQKVKPKTAREAKKIDNITDPGDDETTGTQNQIENNLSNEIVQEVMKDKSLENSPNSKNKKSEKLNDISKKQDSSTNKKEKDAIIEIDLSDDKIKEKGPLSSVLNETKSSGSSDLLSKNLMKDGEKISSNKPKVSLGLDKKLLKKKQKQANINKTLEKLLSGSLKHINIESIMSNAGRTRSREGIKLEQPMVNDNDSENITPFKIRNRKATKPTKNVNESASDDVPILSKESTCQDESKTDISEASDKNEEKTAQTSNIKEGTSNNSNKNKKDPTSKYSDLFRTDEYLGARNTNKQVLKEFVKTISKSSKKKLKRTSNTSTKSIDGADQITKDFNSCEDLDVLTNEVNYMDGVLPRRTRSADSQRSDTTKSEDGKKIATKTDKGVKAVNEEDSESNTSKRKLASNESVSDDRGNKTPDTNDNSHNKKPKLESEELKKRKGIERRKSRPSLKSEGLSTLPNVVQRRNESKDKKDTNNNEISDIKSSNVPKIQQEKVSGKNEKKINRGKRLSRRKKLEKHLNRLLNGNGMENISLASIMSNTRTTRSKDTK